MKNLKYIHVNIQVARHNKKHGTNLPACRIEEGSTKTYCREVAILGPSRMVSNPDKPLKCGATIWIETTAPVMITGQSSWAEITKEMKNE